MPELSIVVPVYNEAPNVEPLVAELRATVDRMTQSTEILLVDDGSSDTTFALAVEATRDDSRFRLIRLRRNFGQTAAIAAGIDHSEGAIIVTMDGDLQNDPADIPRLLATLDEGFDVVTGWRHDRKDALVSRKIPSQIANVIIGAVTSVKIHDHGCGIKAFRGEMARSLRLYGEMHRFITAIAGDLGARVAEIPVHHRPRRRGQSKYGLSRTVRVLLDLLTIKFLSGFATRPIHVFGTAGLLTTIAGVGITGFLGIERISVRWPAGGSPALAARDPHDPRRRPARNPRALGRDARPHLPRVPGEADLPDS